MMKTTLTCTLSLALLAGCAPLKSHDARDTPADGHTARNALDWPGSYDGTLPCADCPGIDTLVEIHADGTFKLRETYQERGAPINSAGTWTIDADGKHLLLDPDRKDADDRHFEIVSKDEVRMLDTEGKPIASELNYSLRRG